MVLERAAVGARGDDGPGRARVAPDRGEAVATGLLIATVLIWGSTPQVTEVAGHYAQPLTLTMLRAAPTGVVMLLALPVLRFRMPRDLSAWLFTAVSGLLMVTVFLFGFTEAVLKSGPGNAIVLASTTPFWVAILAWATRGERIAPRTVLGLIIGFGGVVLVFSSQLGSSTGTSEMLTGLALAVVAALAWAIGTLVVKDLLTRRPDTDLVGLVTGQYLIGGAALLAISFSVEGSAGAHWSASDLWLAVAYISVVGSAIATVAYVAALRRINATRATAWAFVSPVVAVIIGLALGTVPSPAAFAGMAITIAGVAIVNAPPSSAGGSRRRSARRLAAAHAAAAPQPEGD